MSLFLIRMFCFVFLFGYDTGFKKLLVCFLSYSQI